MVPDPELEALRRQIDAVDQKLLELIRKRVELALRVGELKRSNGLAICDPERERIILERLCAQTLPPLDRESVRRVFESVIGESRRLQLEHVGRRS